MIHRFEQRLIIPHSVLDYDFPLSHLFSLSFAEWLVGAFCCWHFCLRERFSRTWESLYGCWCDLQTRRIFGQRSERSGRRLFGYCWHGPSRSGMLKIPRRPCQPTLVQLHGCCWRYRRTRILQVVRRGRYCGSVLRRAREFGRRKTFVVVRNQVICNL